MNTDNHYNMIGKPQIPLCMFRMSLYHTPLFFNLYIKLLHNVLKSQILHPSVLGMDYDDPDPSTVTFNCGSLSSSSSSITVFNDAIVEETTETFSVSVTGSDVAGFPLGVSTTVSIVDDEGMFMLCV